MAPGSRSGRRLDASPRDGVTAMSAVAEFFTPLTTHPLGRSLWEYPDVTVEGAVPTGDSTRDARIGGGDRHEFVGAGYFEITRRTALAELADEIGVPEQAVSERLRRGLSSFVDSALPGDGESGA